MIRHDFQRHNRPSQFGGLRFQQLSEALCNSVYQYLPAPLRTEHEVVSQQRHGGIFVNVGRRHIHSVAQLEGGAGLSIQPSTFAPHPSGGWAIHPRDKSLGFPPRPFSVKPCDKRGTACAPTDRSPPPSCWRPDLNVKGTVWVRLSPLLSRRVRERNFSGVIRVPSISVTSRRTPNVPPIPETRTGS